jgi:two-component system, NarL family, response regulator LiaR
MARHLHHAPLDRHTARSEPVLRVIIADSDPLARRAVRDALQGAGVVVIAEAGNGGDAVRLAQHYQPDVVLMDVSMPGLDGIAATRRIVDQASGVAVVILAARDDYETALHCLRAGASGFLTRTISLEVLARALRAATNGEAVVSRRLMTQIIGGLRRSAPGGLGMRPVVSPLTTREWEVLDLLCQGQSTDDIADTLVLSGETVRSHVKHILRKLNVSSREQAVQEARELRSA